MKENLELRVGKTDKCDGNITTLNAIAPLEPSKIEDNLGFERGRLSRGYWILVLVQKIETEDFEFDGITLRSGGREGKPFKDLRLSVEEQNRRDKMRIRVHQRIHQDFDPKSFQGPNGGPTQLSTEAYRKLQEKVLKGIENTGYSGEKRIVKVRPVIRADKNEPNWKKYPPGGGFLQWSLIRPLEFFLAMYCDGGGNVVTPKFELSLSQAKSKGFHSPGGEYEAIRKVKEYLEKC